MEAVKISVMCADIAKKRGARRGFTLIEILVVISIIAMLLGILMPALGKAKQYARNIIGMSNQRQTVNGVSLFASDNDDSYPPSVSYVSYNTSWNWYDPRTLSSWADTPTHPHRAMSEYLGGYIADASVMVCPKSPRKFKYLQQVWDAGDAWRNPDVAMDVKAMRGSYCYYWSYVGWVSPTRLFEGPRRSSGGRSQSKLLMSCYLGYDHIQTPDMYGSCERFCGSSVREETAIESAWWVGHANPHCLEVKLQAAYTDGHVEVFTLKDAIPMKAIMHRPTNRPYPSGVGPGDFYIPKNALR